MSTAEDTHRRVKPLLTDAEIATLNRARKLLSRYANDCSMAAWDVPSGYVADGPNAADYGKVSALASVAEDMIFTVFNWSDSHHVREMTGDQLHNR